MKKSLSIFTRDWRNISKNWVAAILIGGLILLPSLYAWLNILASWDPYSQTDQLPIGIVNEDKGASFRDRDLQIGDEVVESLKKNDSLEWHFSKREKALDKLNVGDYYAVIVIPENFSEKLITVLEDKPKKAEIEYFVNEKVNAISPKITDKGASTIVEQITSNFVSEVNGTIFDMFNELGVNLEKNQPDIEKFEEYVFKLEESLPDIHRIISDGYAETEDGQALIKKAENMLPKANEVVGNGLSTIDKSLKMLQDGEKRLNEISPKVEADLKKAQQMAEDVNQYITELQNRDIALNPEEITKQLDERVQSSIDNIEAVETVLKQFQQLQQMKPEENTGGENQLPENVQANLPSSETLNQAITQLNDLKTTLQGIQTESKQIKSELSKKQAEMENILTTLDEKSKQTIDKIDAFSKEYNETIKPTVLEEVRSAKKTLTDARKLLVEAQATIPEVTSLLKNTDGTLSEGQEALEYILNEYPYVNVKVNELADRIREIQKEADLDSIIDLLKNDPEAEKSFFTEPVLLNKNSVFPIENYGTGMTPFYTVLSLWVGALLLVSLLSTEVHDEHFSPRQIYFGKLLTFLSISLAQSLVVTLGDIFILKVNIEEPFLFVIFGLFTSFIFMTIVYTLVSVLGNVGKAVAIVFLVLQIAGSGGTYPVALLPSFFQMINPLLPFTYAVDIMREAVGGIVQEKVIIDLLFLTGFGLIFLLIGTFIKKLLNKSVKHIMKKSHESGLFH
ncbi:YhgE/Pip domain-containing protein [Metabacillus malikii]|uniref:Membrane protein n=1 Tax=Metabacillus malikii TaxID=1504265 RepID=A0ABT9ZLJ3_9BACI|nr:YhgE/Pip domain-containing protein [Metabacillus malikii]MDQ0233158.1 putative membrane protein [Metabacillus malikii]